MWRLTSASKETNKSLCHYYLITLKRPLNLGCILRNTGIDAKPKCVYAPTGKVELTHRWEASPGRHLFSTSFSHANHPTCPSEYRSRSEKVQKPYPVPVWLVLLKKGTNISVSCRVFVRFDLAHIPPLLVYMWSCAVSLLRRSRPQCGSNVGGATGDILLPENSVVKSSFFSSLLNETHFRQFC